MDLFERTCGQADFLGTKLLEMENVVSSHYLVKKNKKLHHEAKEAQAAVKQANKELEEMRL